jgi:hypothetical protein
MNADRENSGNHCCACCRSGNPALDDTQSEPLLENYG